MPKTLIRFAGLLFLASMSFPTAYSGETKPADPGSGLLRGVVTLESDGTPLHKVTVLIVQLGRSVETDETGTYNFQQVPAGTYDVVVQHAALAGDRRAVQIVDNATATADFKMRLSAVREQITVTSGRQETAFEAMQSTTSVDSIDLAQKSHTSLGEVLENQPGVAKRSLGPGSTRPVIRGFDGDRVLVMQDGISVGTLGSQSGDHGETLNVLTLERLEIVRGPATLLYGSNAIGGVVNAVTGHHTSTEQAHKGLSGYATGLGGSTNDLGGGALGLEYGFGNWMVFGGSGGQRTGNYRTPTVLRGRIPEIIPSGKVLNSRTRSADAYGGLGRYAQRGFFRLSYGYDDREYGVPTEEDVELRLRRHDAKFTGGVRTNGWIEQTRLTLDYSDYSHSEFEGPHRATLFENKQFSYRVMADHRKTGAFSGIFGISGLRRDYNTIGDEVLAPQTIQTGFSLFGVETAALDRVSLQFGLRLDYNHYSPAERPGLRNRTFTGFSGAVGLRLPLWPGGTFVANYTHSHRAPALEELYNFGPHPGNFAFEIGDPSLRRERGDGMDLSLRHQSSRLRAEGNFFYYNFGSYVFLTPTGAVDPESGLIVARFLQADTRYLGGEGSLDVGISKWFWLHGGVDAVDARLRGAAPGLQNDSPLPRIPPLRGRIGFDIRYKGLSLRPEAVIARAQERIVRPADPAVVIETSTPGYTVFNLNASYSIPRQHFVHVFSITAFNLGNRLYRNHLSFIKTIAPELGRGLRGSYTARFF